MAEVATGTASGIITVNEAGCGITSASDFNVIDTSGGCLTATLSDLIFTEFYDRDGGSLGYIEIYNGTGAPVNLSNYSIRRYGSAIDLIDGEYTLYTFPASTPVINNNEVLFGEMFSPGNTDFETTPDFTFDVDCNFTGGNFLCGGFNEGDIFHLYFGSTIIDVYENTLSQRGFTALRNPNTAGPNSTNNPSDWTENATESISDLGNFVYTGSSASFPTITNPASIIGSCVNSVSFTSNGTPSIGGTLSYQWFFNNRIDANWLPVNSVNLPLTTIAGETSSTLDLNGGISNYDAYQFYCLVTEDGACSTASNAAQLKIGTATWNGVSWNWNNGTAQNTLPTLNSNVVVTASYDTAIGGLQTSFSACNLNILSGTVNIANGDYIEVFNDVQIESTPIIPRLRVQLQGAFVQINDSGTVTGNARISKLTAPMNAWYEYTYWSTPINNAVVELALSQTNVNRRFWFNAQNYVDMVRETNNDGVFVAGQDDVDDNANDWTLAAGTDLMVPGRGYAATLSQIAFVFGPGSQYQFDFDGVMNNGIITVPIYRNDNEFADNNWNFIGNPYPSAINANTFLTENAAVLNENAGALSGAIYLWSQNIAPSANANGNENLNFAQADYAVINGSGNAAGGDGVTPNNFIPSGQGFFVAMDNAAPANNVGGNIFEADVVFNNSMRVTGNNTQFFRAPHVIQPDKLWINLTSDNGVFNQLLVAYVDGATNADDGMYYDAPRNQATGTFASLYSTIENSDKPFAIQGKDPNSLSLNEVIPLGFNNSISAPTVFTISIAQLQGDFMNNNSIYLKDTLLNLTHDLSQSDYNFTAEVGQFNQRFEIVFNRETLSIGDENLTADGLAIIELPNGDVQFIVSQQHQIKEVTIVDLMGRVIYQLTGNHNTETYNLSQLSKAAYIAKVTLANGQTLYKKAVKRF